MPEDNQGSIQREYLELCLRLLNSVNTEEGITDITQNLLQSVSDPHRHMVVFKETDSLMEVLIRVNKILTHAESFRDNPDELWSIEFEGSSQDLMGFHRAFVQMKSLSFKDTGEKLYFIGYSIRKRVPEGAGEATAHIYLMAKNPDDALYHSAELFNEFLEEWEKIRLKEVSFLDRDNLPEMIHTEDIEEVIETGVPLVLIDEEQA